MNNISPIFFPYFQPVFPFSLHIPFSTITTVVYKNEINYIFPFFSCSFIQKYCPYQKKNTQFHIQHTRIASAVITFQFFGAKNDGPKIRDVVHKLEERGRLDNVSFIPTMLEFHEEAALRLQVIKFPFIELFGSFNTFFTSLLTFFFVMSCHECSVGTIYMCHNRINPDF